MQRNHPKRTAILRNLSQLWSAACWLGLIALLVIVFLFFWSNHRSSLPASNSNEDAVFMQAPPNIKRLAVTNQTANGTVYTINNATAVFDADVEPALDRVYTNVASAITAAKDLGREVLPSVDVIHAQCKAFNDDLTWAMEQWLQSGRTPMNKQQALQRLLSSVSEPRAHLILGGIILLALGLWRKGPNWIVTRGMVFVVAAAALIWFLPALRIPVLLKLSAKHHGLASNINANYYHDMPRSHAQALAKQLTNPDPQQSYLAATFLSEADLADWDGVKERVDQALKGDTPRETKVFLLHQLKTVDPEHARERLRAFINHSKELRPYALNTLAYRQHPDDQAFLLRYLNEPNRFLAWTMARYYPDRQTALALLELKFVNRADVISRSMAKLLKNTPGALTAEERATLLPAALKREYQHRGSISGHILEHLPTPELQTQMEDLILNGADDYEALELLGKLVKSGQGERAVPHLNRLQETGAPWVVEEATRWLNSKHLKP